MPKVDVTKYQITMIEPKTMTVKSRLVVRDEKLAKELVDIIERGNDRAGIYELLTIVPVVEEEWV